MAVSFSLLHPSDPVLKNPRLCYEADHRLYLPNAVISSDCNVSTPAFHALPGQDTSQETFEFLGLTAEAATRIWQKWSRFSPGLRLDLDDFVLTHISFSYGLGTSKSYSSQTQMEDMTQIGFHPRFVGIFVDPNLQELFATKSVGEWIIELVHLRYMHLRDIQSASLERTFRAEKLLDEPKQESGGRELLEVLREDPDSVILYHGTSARIAKQFLATKAVSDLRQWRQSDFSQRRTDTGYFSPNIEVAEAHQAFIDRALDGDGSAARILWMKVPDSAFRSLSKATYVLNAGQARFVDDIYSDPDWSPSKWKQLVWVNRRPARLPESLCHICRAELLIGHISKNEENRTFGEIQDWRELSIEKHAMRLRARQDGTVRYAVQYCFQGEGLGKVTEAEGVEFGMLSLLTEQDCGTRANAKNQN